MTLTYADNCIQAKGSEVKILIYSKGATECFLGGMLYFTEANPRQQTTDNTQSNTTLIAQEIIN